MRSAPSKNGRFSPPSGTRWHDIAALVAIAGTLAGPCPARAQDGGGVEDPHDAPFVDPDATAPDTRELDDPSPSPAEPADPTPASWADPEAPSPAPTSRALLSASERPRYWRMARNTVRRPLTLPQGVLRFDSTVGFSRLGPSSFFSGMFGLAAGIFDELELGATPVIVTMTPFPSIGDPFVYARARPFANDELQLALRASVVIPTAALEAQMGLAAELAWTATDWFRLDTGLDYQLLFSQPLHQRVGIPLTATFQLASPNAIALTSGVYVFNDFDDVDVPLLAAWIFAWRGYQGPLGETRIEGGVTDLSDAENAWMIRARMTFFAYL